MPKSPFQKGDIPKEVRIIGSKIKKKIKIIKKYKVKVN